MITVWFFLAYLNWNGGITQVGPFVSEEQCRSAQMATSRLNTTPCYQGVWSSR